MTEQGSKRSSYWSSYSLVLPVSAGEHHYSVRKTSRMLRWHTRDLSILWCPFLRLLSATPSTPWSENGRRGSFRLAQGQTPSGSRCGHWQRVASTNCCLMMMHASGPRTPILLKVHFDWYLVAATHALSGTQCLKNEKILPTKASFISAKVT